MEEKGFNANSIPQKTNEELQKEINYLLDLLQVCYGEIKELRSRLTEYEQLPDGYNKKWTWITKMAFVIARAERPLRSSEIIDALLPLENTLRGKPDRQKYLSGMLSTGIRHGRFVIHKLKGVRGYFYCLPEWIDSEGNLSAAYEKKVF